MKREHSPSTRKQFHIRLKNDRLQEENKLMENILNISMSLIIFLISILTELIFADSEIFYVKWIKNLTDNRFIITVSQLVINMVIFYVINRLIYLSVYRFAEYKWHKENKPIVFRGQWLHIHDKPNGNVRVGVVTIRQSFSQLSVEGFNVSPKCEFIADSKKTTWDYIMAKIASTKGNHTELIGCYESIKSDRSSNQGIHIFNEFYRFGDADDYPIRMSGSFCNTFKVSNNTVNDIKDEKGTIHLFRMPPRIAEHIYKNPRHQPPEVLLASLYRDEQFAGEPFVEELKEILEKHRPALTAAMAQTK